MASIVATLAGSGYVAWNAVVFWRSHPSMSWQQCALGDAPCSTAAATWFLGVVGFFAFGAAFLTVSYAGKMFGIETEPTLGQSPCARHDAKDHPADKELFLTARGQLLSRLPFGVERFELPALFTPVHSAFQNLGRTALAAVTVSMDVIGRDGEFAKSFDWNVGNIKCDQEIHVALYVARDLRPFTVTWRDATERGQGIKFFPEDPVLPSFALPIPAGDKPVQLDLEQEVSDAAEAAPGNVSE